MFSRREKRRAARGAAKLAKLRGSWRRAESIAYRPASSMQLIKFRVYVCVVHTWLVETVVYSRARPSRKLVLGSTPPPSPFSRTILWKRRQTNPFFLPFLLVSPIRVTRIRVSSRHTDEHGVIPLIYVSDSPRHLLSFLVFSFFFFVTGFDFVFIASFTVISRWNTWYTQTIHGDKSRGGRIIRARLSPIHRPKYALFNILR